MASLIYDSAVRDEAVGNINYGTDTFWAMLVTSTYAANKQTHLKRSDVTNEVVGTGYTAGGQVCAVTVAAVDTVNNKVVITLGAESWASATITARGIVYYKRRGGVATADELIAFDDFGVDVTSTAGTFAVAATTITKQN